MPPSVDRETVRAADRALDVLLAFAGERGSLGVSQLAQRLELAKSTVHRLLSTLESKGLVRKDPVTDRYTLTAKVLELAAGFLETDELTSVAAPEIDRLRDELGETASLYVRDGVHRLRVYKAESLQEVRRVVRVGERLPLYAGASGKVLLAFLPPSERADVIGRMALPEGFPLDRFEHELDSIVRRGYAWSIGEREEWAAAVAAPVVDRGGKLRAAIAVSGPRQRFDAAAIATIGSALLQAAARVGKRL